MDAAQGPVAPGHGDHWLAALPRDDPRLRDVLQPPLDAPDGLGFHRAPLTEALDLVQVTLRRRLVTAYPEPRATTLAALRPRELALWDTRVEGWLVADHEGAGALRIFLTDLAAQAHRYAGPKPRGLALELAGLAYLMHEAEGEPGPARLAPASKMDARFLPDDYWFEGEVRDVRAAGPGAVVTLAFQGGLEFPVVTQSPVHAHEGDHLTGYLWLTGRLPETDP